MISELPQELQVQAPSSQPHTSRKWEQELEDAAWQEFGESIYQVEPDWAKQLYHNLATDDHIYEYLHKSTSGYDMEKERWTHLSTKLAHGAKLRASLISIISGIIDHFHPELPPDVTRSVIDSHNLLLPHENGKHESSPCISIKAQGPSFEVPRDAAKFDGLGYTNVTGVVVAGMDENMGDGVGQATQLSVYCRQIFFQQPNRHFARSLAISRKGIQFAHYDRSGAYVTPLYNIHKEKELFVRLILGLVSPNEEVLGLDTSVQWVTDEITGRKVSGTVEVDEWDDEKKASTKVTYNLDLNEPPIVRPTIRGRGTVGWHATHPATNEAVLIKDAWCTGERMSEVEHLRGALGIPGVVEMLAYQDCCAETRNYRPASFKADNFHNRIKLRVVLKKYGTSIWHFKTRLSLLRALRDAIVGHRELYGRGILHRDISMQNILFGSPNAPKGHQGRLIDLDVAVRTKNGVSPVPMTQGVGTRLYQSILVLQSDNLNFPVPQDYMDDLEGFYYVLCHLVFLFSRPGTTLSEPPKILADWTKQDNFLASTLKGSVLGVYFPMEEIPEFWGEAVRTLMDEFRGVIFAIYNRKFRIIKDSWVAQDEKLKALAAFSQDVDVHFERVKAAFDKAIAQLEKEGLCPEELPRSRKSRAAPTSQTNIAPVPPKPAVKESIALLSAPAVGKKRPSVDCGLEDPDTDASHKRHRGDGNISSAANDSSQETNDLVYTKK